MSNLGIRNNSQTAAAYTQQLSFPVDVNEHTYSVGLAQPTSGNTTINAYVDGNLVSSANLFSNFFYTNGIFGFSTLQGCSDLLITPTSVEYTIGLGAHESTSLATQQVISIINGDGQLNLGTATGTGNTLPYNANSPAVLAALDTLGATLVSALPPLLAGPGKSSVLPASGGYGSTPTYIAGGGTTNNLLTLVYYVQANTSMTAAASGAANWTAVVLSNNAIGSAIGNAITVTLTNKNSTQLVLTAKRWTSGVSANLGPSITISSVAFNDLATHAIKITYYGAAGVGQFAVYVDGTNIENVTDSAILGEGYCGITSTAGATSFNVEMTLDTSTDTYEQGSAPVKGTISSQAGGDGSYLQPGVVAGRHLLGATSTDTSAVVDSSGNLLYARQTPAVATVVNSGGTYNAGLATGNLPLVNHATPVQTVINSGGTYNAGLATGNLPLVNHASAVQTVINSGGTYNANLATGDLPFANHDSAVQGTFTRASSSQLTVAASTLFVGQSSVIPASTNFLGGASIGTPSSSATAYTTIGGNPVFSKISLAWPTWFINYPDGSRGPTSGNYPAFGPVDIYVDGFSSGGNILQPSTSYYLSFFYSYGTNGTVTTGIFNTSALTQSQAATFYADGNVTLFLHQGPITTPAKPPSGSSSGSPYVPYQPTCPGYNQLIETRRGHIPAHEIIPGDHLRGWLDGEWNRVHRVGFAYSDIYEVEIEGEKFQVDANHLWWTPYGWWDTKWLHRGDVVMNAEGGVLVVDSLTNLGRGQYVKIKCENQRFRIGRALGHNVITY